MPDGWSFKLNPAGIAVISGDTAAPFAGKAAVKIELPDTGTVNVDSTPVAVEAGKTYLFSIVARSEGFAEKGYAGVTASTAFILLNAENKVISSIRGVQFPYTPSPWKMQDCLLAQKANGTSAWIMRPWSLCIFYSKHMAAKSLAPSSESGYPALVTGIITGWVC
jgi:hypothetical protein